MNSKLDRTLLPQPQPSMKWKNRQLQINTQKTENVRQFSPMGQQPTTTRNASIKIAQIPSHQFQNKPNNNYSNNPNKGIISKGSNANNQNNTNNRINLNNQNTKNNQIKQGQMRDESKYGSSNKYDEQLKRKPQMTQSQYSLQQKELLTFAANRSNESEEEQMHRRQYENAYYRQNSTNNNKKDNLSSQLIQTPSKKQARSNNWATQSKAATQNHSIIKMTQSRFSSSHNSQSRNRSSSKNKQHKSQIYRFYHTQQNHQQQFIGYSVVTKQSKSGMFSNEKLLVLNTLKRQLCYYSKMPKSLPFASIQQMLQTYLQLESPKQTIELDKVKRFQFVPAKGNIAHVIVNYVSEIGERKEWRLGMGNNSVMNEWIELVNQVIKKQHYTVAKSQTKYPPRPKKQPQNKPNNYQTSFTKTLKQQVLPSLKNSELHTSQHKSGLKTSKGTAKLSDSMVQQKQKQYYIQKSKFINTKEYLIDMKDVSDQDIFYVPPPKVQTFKQTNSGGRNTPKGNQQFFQSLDIEQRRQQLNDLGINYISSPQEDTRFSLQLQKKQKMINSQHQNRISTQQHKETNYKQHNIHNMSSSQAIPSGYMMNRKSSGERSSQTTHKDLNIHIDSNLVFQDSGFNHHEHNAYNNSNQFNSSAFQKRSVQSPNQLASRNDNQRQNQSQGRPRGYTELVIGNSNKKSTIHNHTGYPIPHPFMTEEQQLNNHYQKHRHSHKANNQQRQSPKNRFNNNFIGDSLTGKNSSGNKNKSHYVSHHLQSEYSQIEDIIMGDKLNEEYILNFSPSSLNNNWFRLWIQTQGRNKVNIYTAFVKSCQLIVQKIIQSPSSYINCSYLSQNNTHMLFSLQHIVVKIPFKLPLPQGLAQFINLIDFIKSQQFYSNLMKHSSEIQNEFNNYEFILKQLQEEFNTGIFSMPVYMPMCCLIGYKGVSVMCKADIEGSNFKVHKVQQVDYKRYQNQIEYLEDKCHARLLQKGVNNKNRNPNSYTTPSIPKSQFQLYQIFLPSYNKTIIYMQNLLQFLPLIPNPLSSFPIQLSSQYIENYVKTGVISTNKDLAEIQKHLEDNVLMKMYGKIQQIGNQMIVTEQELRSLVIEQIGAGKQYLGNLYKMLKSRNPGLIHESNPKRYSSTSYNYDNKSNNSPSNFSPQCLILTEIILSQYLKACRIFLLKQFHKQLSSSLLSNPGPINKSSAQRYSSSSGNYPHNNHGSNFSSSHVSNNSKTIKNLNIGYNTTPNGHNSFNHNFNQTVIEMLNYLLYKNSKVWTVLIMVLGQKYNIQEFKNTNKSANNMRSMIEHLYNKIDLNYLVLNLFNKLGLDAQINTWGEQTTWSTIDNFNQDTISVTPLTTVKAYSFEIFSPQYKSLLQQIAEIPYETASISPTIKKHMHQFALQTLNLHEQSFNNHTYLVKSPEYELIQMSSKYELHLINLFLSYFTPALNPASPTITKNKAKPQFQSPSNKYINLYEKLLNEKQTRSSINQSHLNYEISLIGIKWLIKQKQYELGSVLIQEQLQSLSIWVSQQRGYQMKIKLYDLAALFYHKKLSNRNNMAFQYSLKSLQLALDNQNFSLSRSLSAEKAFQAANIHFQSSQLQKSLQLYELTQKLIYKSQKNKPLKMTDLSLQFVKIYLRKAQIKLAMGKTMETLYQCLECLKKCQEFQQIELIEMTDHQNNQYEANNSYFSSNLDQIQDLELSAFQIIFRSYEITKNYAQMKKITELCCNKFIQDKFLLVKHTHISLRNRERKNMQSNLRPQFMRRLLKMCWISLIHQLSVNQTIINVDQNTPKRQSFINIPLQSFCLGGVSKKSKVTQNVGTKYNLNQLKQKILALFRLYPKNRYDNNTLSSFVCQQIAQSSEFNRQPIKASNLNGIHHRQKPQQNSTRINDHKKSSNSNKLQALINLKNISDYQCPSILVQKLDQVLQYLSRNVQSVQQGSNNSELYLVHNFYSKVPIDGLRNGHIDVRRNSIERFKNSSSFSQQRNKSRNKSREKQNYGQKDRRQNQYTRSEYEHSQANRSRAPSIYVKKQLQNYFTPINNQLSSTILPFSLQPPPARHYSTNIQTNIEPQLRVSSRQDNIDNYNIYSLKDEMEKKFMLMEAIFGLCGRDFVIGYLNEVIQREQMGQINRLNDKASQGIELSVMFYQ